MSSNSGCTDWELGNYKDKVNRALTTRENSGIEDASLTSLVPLMEHIVGCGTGFLLESKEIGYEIENLLFANIRIDNGRLIETYKENFYIYGLKGYYTEANGEYIMTSYFKNNKPTYTKKNNLWKVWWDSDKNKWSLTSTYANSFKSSTNEPLYGNNEYAHAVGWSGQGQNGSSSHRVLEFWIKGLKNLYSTANGTYKITSTFISDHPTFKHESLNWMIWWSLQEDRWKLAFYETSEFSSSSDKTLFNLSLDVTSGLWVTNEDEHQSGRGPNSEPEATPTPTATPTATETPTPTPTYTMPYHKVNQVVVGPNYSLILRSNGEVEVTGDNTFGNLATGDKNTTDKLRKAKISNVSEIATGNGHTLFLKSSGELFASGKNNYGQLGDGTTTDKNSAVKIADDVKSISCLASSSFYVTNDGNLYGFGYNEQGQLGTGEFGIQKTPSKIEGTYEAPELLKHIEPSEFKTESNQQKVQDLVSKNYYNVIGNAIKKDAVRGNVFDFNTKSDYVTLGDVHDDVFSSGTFSISCWVYVRSSASTSNTRSIGMIASKWYSSSSSWNRNSFILYSNGVFYSAKDNNNTAMLAPNGTRFEIPKNNWHHMVYSLDGGKLKMYMDGKNIPVYKPDLVHEFSSTTTQQLSIGNLYHNKLYTLDGKVDDFRIFNRALSESEANAVMLDIGDVDSSASKLPPIKKVESGDVHTFLISEEDELWAFGQNDKGQLGDDTRKNAYLPKKVFDQKVKKVTPGTFHSVVLTQDDQVYATGDNSFGQLGLSSSKGFSKFVNINKPNTKDIASGSQHSMLVDVKGNLLVTGKNQDGQLGLGSLDEKTIFSQAPLNNINNVYAGANTSYYVIKEGIVFGSGDNTRFQMADGTQLDRQTPVQVGIDAPPTPTPTATATATPTYDEFDTSKTCEITVDYLYQISTESYKSNSKKFEVNVSPDPRPIKKSLVETQVADGKTAKVKDLQISTFNSSSVSVEVISTEIVNSDGTFHLMCEFEIPTINVECELKGVGAQGVPKIINKIVPSDPVQAETRFGHSVGISNRFAIVGAPGDDENKAQDSGSVYFLKYRLFSEMTPTPTPTATPTPTFTPSVTITPTPTEGIYCNSSPCDVELVPEMNYDNFGNVSYSILGDIYDAEKTRVVTQGTSQIETRVSDVNLSTSIEGDYVSNWLFCLFDEKLSFDDAKTSICVTLECKTKFNGEMNIGIGLLKDESYYYFGISSEQTDEIVFETQQVDPNMFVKIQGSGSDEVSFNKDDEFLVGLVCNTNNQSSNVDISNLKMCIGGGGISTELEN
jgi:alpha-tubulin suppressor-like RCC1 family protein/ASC-1-like (ASCH) protein